MWILIWMRNFISTASLAINVRAIGAVRHVHLGESTVLGCRSAFYDNVLWYYSNKLLYWDGIFAKDPERFEVLKSATNSSRRIFDLRINDVQMSDAGVYRCQERALEYGGEVVHELIVAGQRVPCAAGVL